MNNLSRTGKRIDRHIYVFNVLIVMALLVVGDCGLSLNEREKGGGVKDRSITGLMSTETKRLVNNW